MKLEIFLIVQGLKSNDTHKHFSTYDLNKNGFCVIIMICFETITKNDLNRNKNLTISLGSVILFRRRYRNC